MGNTLITIIGNDGERWQFRNDRSDAMREMRFWEMSQNPHYYTTVVAVLSVPRYYKNMNDVTGDVSDSDRRKFAQN